MGLRNIIIRKAYSSDNDDIIHNFYIPVLSNATEYLRLAGYFSSTSLAIAARGVLGLLKNGGSMKIIASPRLQKKDLEVIIDSHENPEKYYEEILLSEINKWENKFVENHIYALGWMLANKRLEIRVAVLYDKNKNPLPSEEIDNRGIFHQKVGILKDRQGDIISFSGSINETASAWQANIEEFKTFRNWISSEEEYVKEDIRKFDNFWNGKSPYLKVLDIPKAVQERMIDLAPKNLESVGMGFYPKQQKKKEKIKLFTYQEEAIDAWITNDRCGIFEMATGTGKTFTALGCVQSTIEEIKNLLTVVACPFQHLVKQWNREIIKFGLRFDNIIIADSSNPKWKDQLTDSLLELQIGYKAHVLVLTTHDTFSSKEFIGIVSMHKKDLFYFLIGDEVHGLGSKHRQDGLIKEYDFRVGLSATPKRYFDIGGTKAIYDFFKETVFTFDLEDAITKINPATNRTFLTPYQYIPKFVALNSGELEDYFKKTRAFSINFSKSKNHEERTKFIDMLLFLRADIIKNAQAKYDVLEKILEEVCPINFTIIYCTPQQIDTVMEILNRKRIISHRFTMSEGTTPQQKFSGLSEREYILENFTNKKYQVLVAMRCLDEGVDIPPARKAIFMASSGNPRQYIQRIGRVIRRHPGKERAIIYDLMVAPNLESMNSDLANLERRIFEKEITRYEQIAKIANNNIEALRMLFGIKNDFLGGLYE